MKWISRRSQIDLFYLTLGLALFIYCIYSLSVGKIYSSFVNYDLLADNSDKFWVMFGLFSLGSMFLIASAFLESPRWERKSEIRRRGVNIRMIRERRNKASRSLLWMFSAYILLPFSIVSIFLLIVIYLA